MGFGQIVSGGGPEWRTGRRRADRGWHIRKVNDEADINLSATSDKWAMTGADGTVVLDWLPKQVHQGYQAVGGR